MGRKHQRWLMTTLFSGLAIAGIAWGFAPSATTSGELLHPANAILYVVQDGAEAHAAAYEKTAAYEALNNSGLNEMFSTVLDRVKKDGLENANPEVTQGIEEIIALARTSQAKGSSLSVSLFPQTAGPPAVGATLVLNQSASSLPVLTRHLQKLTEQDKVTAMAPYKVDGKQVGTTWSATDPQGTRLGELTLLEKDGHLVITFATDLGAGSAAIEGCLAAIHGKGANVSGHRLYGQKSTTEGFVQTCRGWMDFKVLRDTFGPMPLPPTRAGKEMSINDILSILGLDTLDSMTSLSGYKGRACWNENEVIAPGPHKGLLALLDQKAFTLTDLPPLSPNLSSLFAVSYDPARSYDAVMTGIREMLEKADPDELPRIEQHLGQIEDQIGFSLRNDLLASLGGIAALGLDGNSSGFGIAQISLGVKDQQRLQATLNKIFALITADSQGQVVFEPIQKYGRKITLIKMREVPIVIPALCVDKNYLHIGLIPQSVEMALLRSDGKTPKWELKGDDLAAFKELPEGMTSLSYSNTPQMYRTLLGMAPMYLGIAQSAYERSSNGKRFPLRAEDLPPADLVAGPLFANLSVSTSHSKGFRSVSRSSLPSSELFLSTGGVGVGVALLLPAVQQSREAARRAQSRNNLKQIGLALHNYLDTYGFFPTGAADASNYRNGNTDGRKPEERLSWMYLVLPFLDQIALYQKMDVNSGWDSEANKIAAELVIPTYVPPNVPAQPGMTGYVGIAGLGEDGPTLDAKSPRAGAFAYEKPRRLRDFTDGTSNTMMVTETARPGRWAQGGPQTIRPLTQKPYINGPDGFGGVTKGGVQVLITDGSVRMINENVDPKVMEALSTIAGGEVINDDF